MENKGSEVYERYFENLLRTCSFADEGRIYGLERPDCILKDIKTADLANAGVSMGKIRFISFIGSVMVLCVRGCFACHSQKDQVGIDGNRDHEGAEQGSHQTALGKRASNQGKNHSGNVHGSNKYQSDDRGDSFFVHVLILLSLEWF